MTDRATFAWLCDVRVAPGEGGRGVGSTLVRAVLEALEPMGLARVMLATQDAHEVYAHLGFDAPAQSEWLMALRRPPEPRASAHGG